MTETEVAPESTADQATQIPEMPDSDPVPRRRGGFWGGVLGGLIAAGLGFGLATYVPEGWPVSTPDLSPLEARLGAQADEIAALKSVLADLPAAAGTTDLSQIEGRLAAVESALDDQAPRLSKLEQDLAALASQPTASAATTGAPVAPSSLAALSEALLRLQGDVADLRAKGTTLPDEITAAVAAAEARLAEVEARANTVMTDIQALTGKSAALAALARVGAALESGAPYAMSLPDLGPNLPPALTGPAEGGVASLAVLRADLPAVARAALEAARREALTSDPSASWTDRLWAFLKGQTGARPLTPQTGDAAEAVLSRVEAAVAAGDLATALTETEGLSGGAAEALAPWRSAAQTRVDALAAFEALSAELGK